MCCTNLIALLLLVEVWFSNIVLCLSTLMKVVKHYVIYHNCFSSQHAGYGFVQFDDYEIARKAMLRLNGKIMPSTSNPVSNAI